MEIKKYSTLEVKRFAAFLNFRMAKLIFCVRKPDTSRQGVAEEQTVPS